MTYRSADIEVLSGLDPVKRRPGMYTDTARPNHLLQEVIDNSVDEAIAGHADAITVTLDEDGWLDVTDNGRGMPVDLHPEEGKPGVEVILSKLHAGGKFSNKNYQFSGGLHGVGVSVVNALSTRLEVWIDRDGQRHFIAFEHGERVETLQVVDRVPKRQTGTRLRFQPDSSYFDSPRVSVRRLRHLLRAKAVLCPGLSVSLQVHGEDEPTTWYFEDGLADYLRQATAEQETLPTDPFVIHRADEDAALDLAMAWSVDGDAVTESYVNLIPTAQGGTHVNGLRSGLTDALREFCDLRNLLPRGIKLTPDDVWDRLSYVLSIKTADPQFSGQTKERLSSRECVAQVSAPVKDAFALWLNQNIEQGEAIARLAIGRAQARAKKAKQVVRKKVTTGPALPGKLADCQSEDLSRSELFIVEGDSAGGSAKQARDREYQAILPLRGKILNTWEVESASVLSSKEVHDLAVAIGVDPGSTDLSGLRYGKIIILADADSDGLHIATLISALMVRHFPTLVRRGHVFVAMPPLYRIDAGKQKRYALDDAEREHVIAQFARDLPRAKASVTRFKGLGEMSPGQLKESTIDPNTRRLVQLRIRDGDDTHELLDMLLAKKRAADRKAWLEAKGDLAVL